MMSDAESLTLMNRFIALHKNPGALSPAEQRDVARVLANLPLTGKHSDWLREVQAYEASSKRTS